jgi:hypothetical protein
MCPSRLLSATFRGTATVTAVFDFDERPWLLEVASRTVGPDGEFRLGDISYVGDYTIRSDYSGTLSIAAGTLSGTRVSTRETTGHGGTRTLQRYGRPS